MAQILIIEPFFGGSHKQLLDVINEMLMENKRLFEQFTLPAKKWHWRARTSALYFSDTIPSNHSFQLMFASSVLNLAELLALRPDLAPLKKMLYFHENQIVYPVRNEKERDFQYGYNQILSCLVADEILFNSQFNMDSFLSGISSFFKLQPDFRPKNLAERIKPKCRVLYFPIQTIRPLPTIENSANKTSDNVLHICWPHRWEHDKGPETFFQVLEALIDRGAKFQLSVLGQHYSEIPEIFTNSKTKLESRKDLCEILNWGYLSREDFVSVLSSAHVVVSTALHEFFGVSMLEAALLGCYPLCPHRLSYPEIFPEQCLYKNTKQLRKRLEYYCKKPSAARNLSLDLNKFTWKDLKSQYEAIFKMN